jgi:hypothetical protein
MSEEGRGIFSGYSLAGLRQRIWRRAVRREKSENVEEIQTDAQTASPLTVDW